MKGKIDINKCIRLSGPLSFYLLVMAVLIAVWWWEGVTTGSQSGRTALARFLKYLGDAALLTTPFLFFGRRYRWTILIPVYVITLWAVGSVWYYRFWGDLPGFTSVLLIGNVGTELARSVLALWKWSDALILLLPVVLTGCYVWGWRKVVKKFSLPKFWKLSFPVCAVFLFMVGQAVCSHVRRSYTASFGQEESLVSATINRISNGIITNSNDLATNGPIVHFFKSVRDLVRLFSLKIPLDDINRQTVESFISTTPAFPALPDSILQSNQNKNVIIIVVESLNAYALSTKVDGQDVAPVMRGLLTEEGTLSALNIMTQVNTGGSSDGQMILNTGLYPLQNLPTANVLGTDNSFPGLPKILDREENIAIFGDDGNVWNESHTFSSYGFEKVLTRKDYPGLVKELGGDGALFKFASNLIPSLRQPFFIELLTVSMHVPFNDTDIPTGLLPEWADGTSVERNYLAMVNYFDSRLGQFLEGLKEAGIYDDTLIFIVSDHSHELATGDKHFSKEEVPMVMIAVNSGLTGPIDKTAGEIDVFPTLLNLVGKTGPEGWRGAGRTMLAPGSGGVLLPSGEIIGECDSTDISRLREAREVSEIILRTDYFAGKDN